MNIAVTWPKSRSLLSYLFELEVARLSELVINYRVPSWPKKVEPGDRCYMVYNGLVQGWTKILGTEYRDDVIDPTTHLVMRPGVYVIREPLLRPLSEHRPMRGFQGYRYVDF